MKQATKLLLLLLVASFLVGCTSRKSRSEQGMLAKAWHNMNAHYNGYFNANEILAESFLTLEEQHIDNYNQQLAVFPFIAVDNPSVVSSELDRAIEKVAVVVKLHPYSNWTDDSYLLAGQAQFLKQDYEAAETTFRYAVNEFRPKPERRKRPKKGEKLSPDEEKQAEEEREEYLEGLNATQRSRERARSRRDAQRERDRIRKQRQRERKKAQRERAKERKRINRLRRRGIRTPRNGTRQDTTLDQAVEVDASEEVIETADPGPVGMISIFNRSRDLGLEAQEYGDKADGYFLKHRPAYQEARLWLAWTLIKRDKMEQAQLILEDLRNDRGTYADIRTQALAVQAFLYTESNNPNAAIPYLEEAAQAANNRQDRARYWFIAGQLYQQLGQPAQAATAYHASVDARPDYDLQLAAQLNLAQNDFLSGSGDAETALNSLDRLRRDAKNKPYESQIYYAMANVALRSNDQMAGMDFLRKALDSGSAGPSQRLEAYRLLGDLAYDEADYLHAKLYYDSTLSVMSQNDDRYATVEMRRDQLSDIATTLQDIELKDSLIQLANLSPEERFARAEDIFEAQRQQRLSQADDGDGTTPDDLTDALASGSSFWAYDSRLMRRGDREFERTWGDRPLEDNWRRSRRTDAGSLFEAEGDVRTETTEVPIPSVVTQEEVDRLFSDVPTSPNDRRSMELQLTEAYFNLGRLYRDRLEDNAKAIQVLEQLNQDYPASNLEAESWYYLYLAHTEMGQRTQAADYAQKLQQKYPGSNFARAANDPDFASDSENEERANNQAYERAYALFEAGEYEQALTMARGNQSQLLGQHPLRAKYALLMAMATGGVDGREAYVAALRQVVAQYDGSEEQARAREILRILGETGARLPGNAEGATAGNFRSTPDELHYICLVFDARNVELNDVKIDISEYNQAYHRSERIRITNVYLGQDNSVPVLILRRFQDKEAAMAYIQGTRDNADDWVNEEILGFRMLAVSQSNYREILSNRSIAGYPQFYEREYYR